LPATGSIGLALRSSLETGAKIPPVKFPGRWKRINIISSMAYLFLVLAIIFAILGFAPIGGPATTGLTKAFAGVFLSTFFILLFFGKDRR
jgi:uncharacterized membrane protein YtjA (UPF0391 family)